MSSHCSSNHRNPESLDLTAFQTGERKETKIQKKCRSINGVANSCSNGVTIRTQWNARLNPWELARNYLLPVVHPPLCYDKLDEHFASDNSIILLCTSGVADELKKQKAPWLATGVIVCPKPRYNFNIKASKGLFKVCVWGHVLVANVYCNNYCHWTDWQPELHPPNLAYLLDWPKHVAVQHVWWHMNTCQIVCQADWLCYVWLWGFKYAKFRKW